jgi:hypothetical protein
MAALQSIPGLNPLRAASAFSPFECAAIASKIELQTFKKIGQQMETAQVIRGSGAIEAQRES